MNRLLVALILSTGCVVNILPRALSAESRPILYPNKHLSEVGERQASQDINDCSDKAAGYALRSKQPNQGLKSTTKQAARGALLGTVGGAIAGNTGRGAAAGAAVGATGSLLKGVRERGTNDPVYQKYVTACLEDLGYRVLEWG